MDKVIYDIDDVDDLDDFDDVEEIEDNIFNVSQEVFLNYSILEHPVRSPLDKFVWACLSSAPATISFSLKQDMSVNYLFQIIQETWIY